MLAHFLQWNQTGKFPPSFSVSSALRSVVSMTSSISTFKENDLKLIARSLALAALLGVSAVGAKAQSTFTFTLNQPDITVERPASGTIQAVLSGTITFLGGDQGSVITLSFPFSSLGAGLIGQIDSDFANAAFAGTDYSGPVAKFAVSSSTALGLYNTNVGLVNPSTLVVIDQFDVPIARPFSVTVVSSTVPEPGSIALFVGMGVSGAGLVLRRRRNR